MTTNIIDLFHIADIMITENCGVLQLFMAWAWIIKTYHWSYFTTC